MTGRIEFTGVADGSFASGCSPPRLTATQLPSATRGQTSSRRGLAPRRFENITGAPVRVLANAATGFLAGRNFGEFRYGIVGGKHVHFELTDAIGMVAFEGLLWPPVGWLGRFSAPA